MNKMKFIFVLILAPILIFGQAKKPSSKTSIETTKSWIIEKLEMYAPLSPEFPLGSGFDQHKFVVKIDGCNLIIEERGSNVESDGFYIIYTIPIKEMNIPTFGPTSDKLVNHLMNIYFTIKGSKDLIKFETISFKYGNYTKYTSKLNLFIAKNCELDDIPSRSKKAFKDLITSCGGQIVDSAY